MDWFIEQKRKTIKALMDTGEFSPLEAILLGNRGIATPKDANEYYHATMEDTPDPFLFQGMEIAVQYILECLESEIPIRICGDYDQDGVTATVILMRGIRHFARKLGLDADTAVSYAIPDRMEDGYGINRNMVDQAIRDGCGLIITCDNGIAAFDALEYAFEQQIPVIVTDHHQLRMENGEAQLPPAEAVLNPHYTGSGYPFADLCGAGVALKLIYAIAITLKDSSQEIRDLVQFAAMGTIGDVVPLQGENRIIVREGLRVLNERRNPGIDMLLRVQSWSRPVNVYAVGFLIGPCINASGRLVTARLAVELLLEEDESTLEQYARELCTLNHERQELTGSGVESALENLKDTKIPHVIVEYLPEAHESVCGLIAGRIKDQFYRPTLIFTDAQDEGKALLKGSGRSIPPYNMFEELNQYRDRYVAFGGHAMACGMTIAKADFDSIRTLLNQNPELENADWKPFLAMDTKLLFRHIDFRLMNILDRMQPFGSANQAPNFVTAGVNLRQLRLVGAKKNVLQLVAEQDGISFRGVLFQGDRKIQELQNMPEGHLFSLLLQGREAPISFDIAYRPEWNEFQGNQSIQLRVLDLRFSKTP